MSLAKRRQAASMNAKLSMIKEGEHYNADLKSAPKERMLFKNPDPEEANVGISKMTLAALPMSYATRRDITIDYMNPREEQAKYSKYVDQIPAFDKGPPTLLRPYDDAARQQINLVVQGRSNFILEEGKYDMTMQNADAMKRAAGSKVMPPPGQQKQPDPGQTPQMKAELARASLMETTQSL